MPVYSVTMDSWKSQMQGCSKIPQTKHHTAVKVSVTQGAAFTTKRPVNSEKQKLSLDRLVVHFSANFEV
jgi:protein-tyrosine phosphatase